jgi:hypothetical protein
MSIIRDTAGIAITAKTKLFSGNVPGGDGAGFIRS